VLKQIIEGLNKKLENMQKLTDNLQMTIDQKESEISRLRSVQALIKQKTSESFSGLVKKKQSLKKEKAC